MQHVSLVAATITTGLIAGLFFTYANNVMPALRGADDRAFVATMQRINRVILNPLFLGAFVGGLLTSIGAAVATWRADDQGPLPWVGAGAVLYVAMVVITRRVNIPLNLELDAIGDVDAVDDAHAVRARFEGRWVTWNLVRAVASVGAFGCLVAALVVLP